MRERSRPPMPFLQAVAGRRYTAAPMSRRSRVFSLPAAILAIGAIAIAIAIAGCGGGGDSTTASTGASGATGAGGTALSQADFVSQANAACADANSQVEAL